MLAQSGFCVIFSRKQNQKQNLRVEGLLILHPLPTFRGQNNSKTRRKRMETFPNYLDQKRSLLAVLNLIFPRSKQHVGNFHYRLESREVLTSRDQDESAPAKILATRTFKPNIWGCQCILSRGGVREMENSKVAWFIRHFTVQ